VGDTYSKRVWEYIRKALPFLKSGQATHSFRHTVVDSMKGAGVSPEIRADFAGHKLSNETQGRYSKRHVELLWDATKAIPKVTSHLVPFPVRLLPKRLRAARKARAKPLTT